MMEPPADNHQTSEQDPDFGSQSIFEQKAPSVTETIFIGDDGLRAGWKILLFALLYIVASTIVVIVLKETPESLTAPLRVGTALPRQFLEMLAVLIPTWILARFVDRRRWSYFGIPLRSTLGTKFWVGALVGVAALALQLLIMHLGGWFDFGSIALHGSAVLKYAILWALVYLFVGVTEEGLLRGYPQRVLTNGFAKVGQRNGYWLAAFILSVVFAALHKWNPGENSFGIFMIFIDGLIMCFSLWRTGDLWFAIGNHAAWDWGMTYLFGTPNSGLKPTASLMHPTFHGPALLSGGSAGPEGSMLVLLSEALIALTVAVIYRKRQYVLLQDEEPVPAAPPAITGAPETI